MCLKPRNNIHFQFVVIFIIITVVVVVVDVCCVEPICSMVYGLIYNPNHLVMLPPLPLWCQWYCWLNVLVSLFWLLLLASPPPPLSGCKPIPICQTDNSHVCDLVFKFYYQKSHWIKCTASKRSRRRDKIWHIHHTDISKFNILLCLWIQFLCIHNSFVCQLRRNFC